MDFKISEDIKYSDSSSTSGRQHLNILLVEDNKIDQKILTSFLSETDYGNSNLLIADKIETALEILRTESIDLMMLDLFLPDSHGVETIVGLKNIAANIPIIVLSGMSDKNYAAKTINYGAQDFIVKGEYSASDLEKGIKYAVERQLLIKERKLAEKEFQIEIENERQRVAMDIHDGVGQMLIAIKYKLASIDLTDHTNLPNEIEAVEDLLVKTIDEARKISEFITPRVMNEYGIKASIEQMCDQLQKTTSIQFHIDITEGIPVHDINVLTNIYRISQESINNIIKYSSAHNSWIQLSYQNDELNLEISDDGIGFDLKNYEPGNGLKNIKRRAGFIDGSFHLESMPNSGTRLQIKVPYLENLNK